MALFCQTFLISTGRFAFDKSNAYRLFSDPSGPASIAGCDLTVGNNGVRPAITRYFEVILLAGWVE